MPATQRKCINRGLTLDVDRHYIGSVTATIHQEKGIITLESNPSRGTVLPAPHGKGNKCDKNVKYKRTDAPKPNTRGIGPLVGRTSGYRNSVIHVLAVILSMTYLSYIVVSSEFVNIF